MKSVKIHLLVGILVSLFVLVLAGCGGSGSGSDGNTGGATISGKVADGYVSGADVYAYSDADMTNQIGAGSTDSEGNFSMVLSVSPVPDPLYLKSVGGIDVETQMPAPTMLFVASGSSDTFNITPLTDCLYKYSLKMGIDDAKEYLTGQLLISEAELYDDPVANTDLTPAVNRVLSTSAAQGTLSDGDYVVKILLIDSFLEVGEGDVNVNISNGVVSATEPLEISDVTFYLSGKVQGSSIVLTLADDPDPAEATVMARVAGDIGLMGSVSGVFTIMVEGPELYTSMFVASFVPEAGFDEAEVANVVSSIYSGSKHIVLRDIFYATDEGYKLGWGDLNIAIDPDTGEIDVEEGATIWFDWGTDPYNEDFAPPDDYPGTLEFLGGEFLQTFEEGLATNIIYLQFYIEEYDAWLEIYQAIGSRKGVFVFDGDFYWIGDVYLSTSDDLAPSLEAGTPYEIKVAKADVGMLGQPRSHWINVMPYSDNFTTPDVFDNSTPDFSGNVLKIYQGSLIAFKSDTDDDALDDDFDYVRLAELYESGAIQGEEIMGGYSEVLEDYLSYYPATFVGFVKKPGETAPSAGGTRNFLARVLYTLDPFTYEWDPGAYLTDVLTGDLTISGSTATLNWTKDVDTSGTASLTAENTDGLYHMHGNLDSSTYIDIFWAVGGKKSVYIASEWDEENTEWIISEVGEAYLTY